MNPSPPTTLLAMLAAAVSGASAIPLHAPQDYCVHIHDVAGSVTLNFNNSPSQLPPPLQSEGPGRGMFSIVAICIFVAVYFLYTIPPLLRDRLSRTESEHVHRAVPSGRSSAVSLGVETRTASPTEQLAVSFDEEIASANVPPPAKPPPPTEQTALLNQARLCVYTKSNLSPSVDLPCEASTSSFINCYNRCASLRRGYRVAQNDESSGYHIELGYRRLAEWWLALNLHLVVHPESSYCPPCSNIDHATTGESSPHNESAPQSGDEAASATESSGPTSNTRSPLMRALGGLGVPYTVAAFSFLAIELDWSHCKVAPLPGVKDDLEWLRWIFSGADPSIAFHTLTNATKDIIRSKILEMFREACLGTVVVIHLNGHGANNSFLLYDFQLIDASQLIEWINEIRAETEKYLTVCILFDHCQFDSSIPPPIIRPGEDIHILWGCLPGQRSADFKMSGDDEAKIPRSNLLKAICLLVDDICTRPAGSIDCFIYRISDWMDRVVRMMRAEECRMRWCWRPCTICSCPSYKYCSHAATRSRHPVEESYPRLQNPDGMFWGFEACVCVYQLLHLIEPAASPFLERMQETAGRIKAHRAYGMLDENGSYTWSTLRSIVVSIPGFILSSILLLFARIFTPKQPEPVTGSVPSSMGLPGENNRYRPDHPPKQRGREVNTAVGLVLPLAP